MSGYARESSDHVPFTVKVKVDGVETEVFTGVEVAVVMPPARPTTWVAPVLLDGKLGVMNTGLAVGIWDVWGRVTGRPPETPAFFMGNIRMT